MYSAGSKSAPQCCPSPSTNAFRAWRPEASGRNRSASNAIGVIQEVAHANLFGGRRCGELELGQVRDDSFVEINGASLDLLVHETGSHDLGDRSEEEAR